MTLRSRIMLLGYGILIMPRDGLPTERRLHRSPPPLNRFYLQNNQDYHFLWTGNQSKGGMSSGE